MAFAFFSLAFEYTQLAKYRILPATSMFRESFRFVESQSTRCHQKAKPLDEKKFITLRTRSETLY